MEFDKNQLYEIEKVFDYMAGQVLETTTKQITALQIIENKEFLHKIFQENAKYYDLCRSISAICEKIRENFR
jgi:hypothetical protein